MSDPLKKIVFTIIIFIVFPVQLSANNLTSLFKDKTLIILVSNITLEDKVFEEKGIYSLVHNNPKKNIKDLLIDFKKINTHFISMESKEYISWGYTLDYPVIIIKDINKNELKNLLNYKPIDRTIMLTSLSNSLNPLWIKVSKTGLLNSNSTKREGFIKYTDLIYLIGNNSTFSANSVYFKEKTKPLLYIKNIYYQNKSLLLGRYIIIVYILITYLLFYRLKKYRIFYSYLIFICLILSTLFGFHPFIYLNGIIKSILIIILSVIIGSLINKSYLNHKIIFIIIWLSNLILLYYFTFSRIFLYQSPIGFNNIFQGTRFYGWNNDLIGIFLGSLLGTLYIIGSNKKFKIITPTLILLFICILCFSPLYGANVGGMLSSFFAIIIYIFIIENSIMKKIIIITLCIISFLLLQRLFIYWDLSQNSSTHWGIWIKSVYNKDFSFSIEVIYIKVKQILLFLLLPPLNIFLFLQWFLFYRLRNINLYDKKWRKIIFLISFAIVFLNDSGIFSSILMNFYFLIPIYCFSFYN